ncbi:glycoside hydrolase family 15 protein [Gilvimarinus sp. F26214L]|uniref:glycoside hydrolase family 15 protein n=1 Tax=Gilvimarinus sp. DZF01 TaxID=3461371 RepID=UPI00404591A6
MNKSRSINCNYPPIGSLGAIGDGHSLALLASDGTVEWFCPERFDAPPLFWSLLDRNAGGYLRVGAQELTASCMSYHAETAVLNFEWRTETGSARACVCMEWPGDQGRQRMLWKITGVEGTTEIGIDLCPRPDFGRAACRMAVDLNRADIATEQYALSFRSSAALSQVGERIVGCHEVRTGDTAVFCLELVRQPAQDVNPPFRLVETAIESTVKAWEGWVAGIRWGGSYRDDIVRSAITLKLLIYEPTGAMVAAGTTGLPEEIGGVRNWDYRYTWFRDAGMVMDSLYAIGCEREAQRWAAWMQEVVVAHGMPLQVRYTVDRQPAATEVIISGAEGYRGSAPVRVGNAAAEQFQLDIYGELLECVFICDTMDDDTMRRHWDHLHQAADFIASHWQEADKGIWEVRSAARHLVHSKAAAWAGLQRALWMQAKHNLKGNVNAWRKAADSIKAQVLERGVSSDGKRFIRAYGDPRPDASLLLLARFGIVDGCDQRFRNTVRAVQEQLRMGDADSGLIRRYPADLDDGLPGTEGAFVICGFWLVDALSRMGRHDHASSIFRQLLSLQGSCGLYAEELDPRTKQHLGNFPQAFSHVGLINAALQLESR